LFAFSILSADEGLQPHESSSETRDALAPVMSLELQPHESSSETTSVVSGRVVPRSLQPHESSSETVYDPIGEFK